MIIKQFQDKPLAHYSYAILSGKEIALVDPSRDPEPYYRFAEENNAKIIAVFETHPHADFVSGHLQIHEETGANIYVSKLVGAEYPHKTFDDGDIMQMNKIKFTAINTPGHSPDSITIVAEDENSKHAMFTGDTLFIGDVGRPDLRENAGNMRAKREQLAEAMFHTMKHKFNHLPNETLVYPAHGAGSLCGKNMSSDPSSTLGNERLSNWAFKDLTKKEFVEHILQDQPFIPYYFGFNVDINKVGALPIKRSIAKIPLQFGASELKDSIVIIDTRDTVDFKKNHFPNSINIMARNEDDKIETWLGSIVTPEEPFYLVLDSIDKRAEILERIAKIGYENQIKAVLTIGNEALEKFENFDLDRFKKNSSKFTIVDIRNASEVSEAVFFDNAINIPLNDLRNSIHDIPTDKPIVVHCAGGYRSAAGSSILSKEIKGTKVYDLSDSINKFK
ncbi:rhodanese-like domain-containing protein [Maribacter hydrothermalis]|uniref:Sulfurtransferase n=1 Tax=Maribacter hydrothermalis TaxID=1836467 RepID=A0A1B7YZ20_9FLAO|nr:rhodanese-like domain-containing protein [Maribacter hydrothermalis]APQ16087.1 MBL fold metallo-hydrolase [Maribacter hydrothermalis]OBR35735.1 sulfurtransferase [Maribacter hydrothermalis]